MLAVNFCGPACSSPASILQGAGTGYPLMFPEGSTDKTSPVLTKIHNFVGKKLRQRKVFKFLVFSVEFTSEDQRGFWHSMPSSGPEGTDFTAAMTVYKSSGSLSPILLSNRVSATLWEITNSYLLHGTAGFSHAFPALIRTLDVHRQHSMLVLTVTSIGSRYKSIALLPECYFTSATILVASSQNKI